MTWMSLEESPEPGWLVHFKSHNCKLKTGKQHHMASPFFFFFSKSAFLFPQMTILLCQATSPSMSIWWPDVLLEALSTDTLSLPLVLFSGPPMSVSVGAAVYFWLEPTNWVDWFMYDPGISFSFLHQLVVENLLQEAVGVSWCLGVTEVDDLGDVCLQSSLVPSRPVQA